MEKRRVTWWNVIGYACINFLGSGAQTVMGTWLMIFYVSNCHMSAVAAGSIFALARLIDAFENPLVGYLSDALGKTWIGRKIGRRRFFILIAVPIILIIFPLLWRPNHSFHFYLLVNLAFEVCFTMVVVTAATLPTEMSQSTLDRTKMISAKQYNSAIASMIALAIPGFLFAKYGNHSVLAFEYTGIFYGIILAVSLLATYLLTFERDPKEIVVAENGPKNIIEVFSKMFIDIIATMKIKAFRMHVYMVLLISVYKFLATGVFAFFIIYVLGLQKSTTAFITSTTIIASFVSVTIAIVIAYRYGGPKLFRVASYVIIATTLGYYVLSKMTHSSHLILLLIILTLISNAAKSWAEYVPVFQFPYMADIDEAVTMQRREGVFSGINSFMGKIASSFQALLLGVGLSAFGFVEGGKTQTEQAIHGIIFMMVVVPIIVLVITYFVSLRLKLTKESHKLLVDEVARIKAGGAMENVTKEAKGAIEELTGYSYEACFGNNKATYLNKISKSSVT